jgi:hypothetical protein
MGGAKPHLETYVVPSPGACPSNMCIDLEHCNWRPHDKRGKVAFVVAHGLDGKVGERFTKYHHTLKTIHAKVR